MKLTSFGGAGEVTGSKHIVEVNGLRILLDCGLFQGRRVESWEKNQHFGFDVNGIHAVILSHAHIDHSGLLPMLYKFGYKGVVYATPATRDLCAIMLMDSAHIQERDAEWLSKKSRAFMPPLYDQDDVRSIMKRFISIPYEVRFSLNQDTFFTFRDAGHVLGSAMVELEYTESGTPKRFIYSGDIGRAKMAILEDPWEPHEADFVLMESTYGNRDHDPMAQMENHLAEIINTTAERGGKIIVPTFALERAQEMIYALKRLQLRDAIPDIPVIVDSPLTVNVTEVFRLHTDAFDAQFRKTMEEAGDPFQLNDIRYIRSLKQSLEVNKLQGPAIIISAAGMCEHGRILHHIRNHCENQKNTILIIGFQAKYTLGRRIVERQRNIKIFGVERQLNAEVRVMNEFSAHAGRSELIGFARRFREAGPRFYLSHGEPEAAQALKSALEAEDLGPIHIQEYGVTMELN